MVSPQDKNQGVGKPPPGITMIGTAGSFGSPEGRMPMGFNTRTIVWLENCQPTQNGRPGGRPRLVS